MKKPSFDEAHFWKFASNLIIPSKEFGEMRFDKPIGTQRYFIHKVAEAINEGAFTLVILKGRQLGISTVMLALDLYWMFMHRGIMGSIIAQDEMTRDDFREKMKQYYDSLPREWRQVQVKHDRNLFGFRNKSSIIYQIAGKRSGNKLGRGKGITFLHATELGSWGNNEAGLASLKAALAEQNPDRLFVYESTANGYDMFYDMWETATRAVTQRAIFIPWWMNELYSFPEEHAVYRTYFGKPCSPDQVVRRLDPKEAEWVKAVKRMYKYQVTANQIAWWRWKLNEEFASDLDMMQQEYPPTEDYAFRLTGSQFYPSAALNDLLNTARERKFIPYTVTFGNRFEDTQIVPSDPRHCNLRIYLPAMEGAERKGAYYTLGADPAYGSSDWKDGSAIHIDRCYGDYIEQAADFHSTSCTTTQFAWVIAMLAGWYENTLVNLEVNGPGQVVYQELDQLYRIAASSRSEDQKSIASIFRNVKAYRYIKYNGSSRTGNTMHWITTPSNKDPMLSAHRDTVVRGMADIASVECIDEMRKIVRDDGFVGAAGRDKDDRVIAAALSHIAWVHQLRVRLMQLGITKMRAVEQDKEMAQAQEGGSGGNTGVAVQYVLHNFLAQREQFMKERAKARRLQGLR